MRKNIQKDIPHEFEVRPSNYSGPNLNPRGVHMRAKRLGEGVYAFISSKVPRNNSGVIIGQKGALVIDAGIGPSIASQIQKLVSQLTDKPILYLVNTTYHGDHSFGNAFFNKNVQIIAHEEAAKVMFPGEALEKEKRMRARNMHTGSAQKDMTALDDVTTWRGPDIVVKDSLTIDLGDRHVQLHFFGPGNSRGDVVVYEPMTQTAWTGNLVGFPKTLPMLLESEPVEYCYTLLRMLVALPIQNLVPAHGFISHNNQSLIEMIAYNVQLHHDVGSALTRGLSLDETYAACPLNKRNILPFPIRFIAGKLMKNLHALNVQATYTRYKSKDSN